MSPARRAPCTGLIAGHRSTDVPTADRREGERGERVAKGCKGGTEDLFADATNSRRSWEDDNERIFNRRGERTAKLIAIKSCLPTCVIIAHAAKRLRKVILVISARSIDHGRLFIVLDKRATRLMRWDGCMFLRDRRIRRTRIHRSICSTNAI